MSSIQIDTLHIRVDFIQSSHGYDKGTSHLLVLVELIDALPHVLVRLLVAHASLGNDAEMKHLHQNDQHAKNDGVSVGGSFVLEYKEEALRQRESCMCHKSHSADVEQDFRPPCQVRALQERRDKKLRCEREVKKR